MRIPLALFADYANANRPDGKLDILGGGIRAITFPAFPAVQPLLALAIGIEASPEELGQPHRLQIVASGPTDNPIIGPVAIDFTVPHGPDPAKPGYSHFVSTMVNVSFVTPGTYAFAISIDGHQLERVELQAEGIGSSELNSLLQGGYLAFNQGDAATAEQMFRSVVERWPEFAVGHNNLGFVLLAKGEAVPAINEFEQAKRLGYLQPEILDANIGAAMYLSGEPARALSVFVDCLRTHVFRSIATLFGIGPNGIFPVQLNSAAEYGSLMALDAAWCAKAVGDSAAFSHFRAQASAGELSARGDDAAQRYNESLAALSASP